jgi:phosphatidylglycerol:prolipoprotein diacylglycerol transferase
MDPVLLRWGRFTLYSYTAFMALGIVIAVAFAHRRGRRAGHPDLVVLDGALWTLVGGLVGARAAYVVPNWADYAGQPTAILSLWGGGLVFQGGLFGGAVALWLYSRYVQRPFLPLADIAAIAVALAQGVAWVGALIHGAHYGVILRLPLSMWLPDLYGIHGPRFPTQLLASLLGLGLFYSLYRLSELRPRPGMVALVYLFGNGVGHFALEFTRADEAFYVGILRATQVAELAEAVLAAGLLLHMLLRHRSRVSPPPAR